MMNTLRRPGGAAFRPFAGDPRDGTWLLDSQGRFLDVNDAYCLMSGYRRQELMHQFLRKIDPELGAAVASRLRRTSHTGTRFEALLRPKFGHPAKVEVSLHRSPVDYGHCYAFVRRLPGPIFRGQNSIAFGADEATRRMESLGVMAGGFAHEFNNLLMIMLGYTELAADDLPNQAEARNDLAEVMTAGRRAKDLVEKIMVFGRRRFRRRSPQEIFRIVTSAVQSIERAAPDNIEVQARLADVGLLTVDPTEIRQIVVNLAVNAIQAMKSGGVVTVELKQIKDEATLSKGSPEEKRTFVKLTVADQGLGMSADLVDRIFEPFFTTRRDEGSKGLGLSVVHGIVKDLGGLVSVNSLPGRGTRVEVYLPQDD